MAKAQVSAYTFAQVSGTYTAITGGTVVATAISANTFLDTSTFPAAIPFSFTFNGTAYSTVNINSNGSLIFGTASTVSTPISSTATYDGAISVLGRDNQGRRVAPIGELRTETLGSGSARTFVVQFSNFARFGTVSPGAAGDNFNFQVRLNETSNTINLVYGAFTFDGTSNTTAQVGLRGAANTDFNNRTITSAGFWTISNPGTANSSTMYLNASVKPASGLTYIFTPPACATPAPMVNCISTTSAQVNFTAVSGDTYTISTSAGSQTVSASPVTLSGLTPATAYTVSLVRNCGGAGGTASPTRTVTFSTSATANDDPAGAVALPLNATCTPVNDTNVGATTTPVNGYGNAGTAPANCGIATSPKDVWYTVTTDASGGGSTAVTITVTGVPASQIRAFSSASGCAGPFTQIGCSSTSATVAAPALTLTGLTAGTTYYVRISGYGSTDTQGAFTICATIPAACAAPTAVASNTVTDNSANITFAAGNGNTSYSVTATPTAGPGTTPVTVPGGASPVSLTGLTGSTTYSVVVTGNCSGTGTSAASTAISFTTLATPPANDNPTGAVALALGATCTPTNGTNASATTTPVNGYANPGTAPAACGIAISPKDVWYSFATDASGGGSTGVTITVTGVPASQIRVFSATSNAGSFTQIGCSSTSGTVVAPALTLTALTASTTYYVRISGNGSADATGAFTICATIPAACAAPTGVASNTVTDNSANITFAAGTGNTSYSVTATPTAGPGTTPVTVPGGASPVSLTGLTGSTTYSVVVTGNCSGTGTSAASTAISFTTLATPPANDNPTGAVALALGATCTPTNGTNASATTTPATVATTGYANPGTAPANCGIAINPKDVWYTVTTDASGGGATGVTITVTGVPASQIRVFSAASNAGPFTQIGCSSTSATVAAPALTLTGLTASTTYYVRISGYGSTDTQGAFTICATIPAACAAPTAVASNTVTDNSANITFAAGTGNTSYSVTATPTAGPGTTPVTVPGGASPVSLTGLTGSTTYSVVVTGNCSGTGTSAASTAISFTTLATPPANDNPTGAVALALGATCTPTNGTNAGATTTPATVATTGYANPGTAPAACGIAVSPKDVWYSFTTAAAGAGATAATITVTGVPASQIRVFSATSNAGPFTQIGCSSTSGTVVAPALTLMALTASTTYYVRISGNGSADATGAFTICATSTCTAPSGITFTGITATGATVNFSSPGIGNTRYTVTATPTTGLVATNNDAASPISLSGLQPSMNYSVTVQGNCGATSTPAVTFTTAPTNDNPASATALAISSSCTPTSTTSVGATTTTPSGYTNPGCSGATTPLDVWYSFTTAASGAGSTTATVTVSGTPAGQVRVFSASSSAGPFTEVLCTAASGSNQQAPALGLSGLTLSTTYYVAVSPYGNTDTRGAFTICVTDALPSLVLGTGNQTIPPGSYSNITIPSGSVTTISGNVTVTGALVVQAGGTLNTPCSPSVLGGSGSFSLAAGATLGICNSAGLSSTPNTGAVQLTGGTSYSSGATYVFNGTGAQSTGNAFPAQVANLTVGSGNLTLSQPLAITQVVTLTSGNLVSNGNLTLISVRGGGTALVANTGSGVVEGSVAVQRAIDITTPDNIGYTHFTPPVSGMVVSSLATPTFTPILNTAYNTAAQVGTVRPFPTMFKYDETRVGSTTLATDQTLFNQGFSVPAANELLVVGKGYDGSIPNATLLNFTGTLSTGDAGGSNLPGLLNLTRGATSNSGLHLLGNPYPSPIDAYTMTVPQFSNLVTTIYVWHASSRYLGDYSTYQVQNTVPSPPANANNNIGTTSLGGTSTIIPSGAAFFVQVATRTTAPASNPLGALLLKNTNRVTTFGPQPAFGRQAANPRTELRLQLDGAGKTDETYLVFDAAATAALDVQYDAPKLTNPTGFNLATMVGTQKLAINRMPAPTAAAVVPVYVSVPAVGSFTLTAATLANFGSTTVYLRDALTGTRTLLTAGAAYRFTTATTTVAGRFALEFAPAGTALATAAQTLASQVQLYPNPTSNRFHVVLPAGAKAMSATLSNVLGQTVLTRSLTSNEADFDVRGLAAGIYTLRLMVDGNAVTRKVVVE